MLMVLLVPIYFLVGIGVLLYLGRPVIFRQERPGLNEKVFTILKFRTMHNTIDSKGNLLPANQRITKFGNLLRRTSMDELPELYNVLKGDMSFVGPRPLLIRYLPFYNDNEKKRHLVRPGITGLAQIKGRNFLDWDKRLALDVFYVENLSFKLDVKILINSILPVLKREGIELNPIQDFDSYRSNASLTQN